MNAEIKVEKASGVKCPRCLHYSWSMNHDNLCNRCVAILTKHQPEHESVAMIIDNLNLRGLTPEDNPEWGNV